MNTFQKILPLYIFSIITFSCDNINENKNIDWSNLKSKLVQTNDEQNLDMGMYLLGGYIEGEINVKRKIFTDKSKQHHVTKKLFGPEGIKRVYSGDNLVTVVLNTYGTQLIIKSAKEKEEKHPTSSGLVFGFVLDNVLLEIKKAKAYELKGGGEMFFMMNKFKKKDSPKIIEKEIIKNINKFNKIHVDKYLGLKVPKMRHDIVNRLVQKEIRLTKVLLKTLELSEGEYKIINPKYIDEITSLKVRAGDLLIDQENEEMDKYLDFTNKLEKIRSDKINSSLKK